MPSSKGRYAPIPSSHMEKAPFLSQTDFSSASSSVSGDEIPLQISPLNHRQRSSTPLLLSLLANFVLVLALLFTLLRPLFHTSQTASDIPTLYSPALEVANTPKLVKFSPAFGSSGPEGIYKKPPSAEVDAAWKALYFTTLMIDQESAEKLPNKTIPVSPAHDAGYLTGLSVFHDLHCLDSIRKALWGRQSRPQRQMDRNEHEKEKQDAHHLMHCIDNLRETLMCHVDVAPLSWQYSEAEGGVRVFGDVVHQCRDFDAVLDWAKQHSYRDGVDFSMWPNERPPQIGKCAVDDEGCGWD